MSRASFFIFAFLALILSPFESLANNKSDEDPMFEPRESSNKGVITQVFLSAVDLVAASYMGPGKTKSARALKEAESALDEAEMLLSYTDKAKLVDRYANILSKSDESVYRARRIAYGDSDGVISTRNLTEREIKSARDYFEAEKLRAELSPGVVPDELKEAKIAEAKEHLAKVREADLNGKLAHGMGGKTIRGIRRVGSVIFISDFVGRIYVWNALDAKPGLAPAGTYLWHKGNDLFSWAEEKREEISERRNQHE